MNEIMDHLSNDHLFLSRDKEIVNLIGTETIYYSNKISKISSFGIKQERNLILTNDSLVLLNNKKLKRKMKYDEIHGISFSKISNDFIIHGEKEYDLHLFCQDKDTIIYIIIKFYEKNLKKSLILCEIDEKNLKSYVTTKKDKKKDPNYSRMDESKAIDTLTYIIDNDPIERKKRSNTEAFGGKSFLMQNIIEESPVKISTEIIFSNDKSINKPSFKDFNIMKIIGRGNVSKIFLVQYTKNNNLYALKSISKNIIESNFQYKSKEKLIQNLNHPFLININTLFETKDRIYFLMPLIQGEKLSYHIKTFKNLEEEKVKFYAASIILLLDYLHKNEIICRDLTPDNILIDQDGYIKITPFHIERFFELKKEIAEKIEKNEYNSPEILSNNEDLKGADWWNLGIIIYEMIYGIPPFYIDDENKMEEFINKTPLIFPRKPLVSENIKNLIKRLLTKKLEERLGYNKGYEEIKNHPFFKDFNFDDLLEKKIESPYKPNKKDIESNKIIKEKYTFEDLIKYGMAKKS